MRTQSEIKTKFDRVAKALAIKPSTGMGKGVSPTRIAGGLACETREGEWTLRADMPEAAGGEGSAPTPGVLGRAALGSCLAIGYMLWASKLEVPVSSLEVEVEAHWDDGATFGTSDSPPGYLEIRYTVRVASDAPEEAIRRFIDAGDRHSPYLDVFCRPQSCQRSIEIIRTKPLRA